MPLVLAGTTIVWSLKLKEKVGGPTIQSMNVKRTKYKADDVSVKALSNKSGDIAFFLYIIWVSTLFHLTDTYITASLQTYPFLFLAALILPLLAIQGNVR